MRTRPFTPIAQANLEEETVLQDYRNHVEERAAQNIPPKPLNAEQVAALVDLLKNPPEVKANSSFRTAFRTCTAWG